MTTLTIKWLNGDLQPIEVNEGTPAYQLILQLGLTLLETTLYTESGELIEHYHLLIRDQLVHILVQPAPITVIVYEVCGVDYYVSTAEADTFRADTPITLTRFTPEVKYDKLFIDYISYGVYCFPEKQQELLDRLGVSSAKNILYFHCTRTLLLYYQVVKGCIYIGEAVGWKEFIRSLSIMGIDIGIELYEEMLFPTVTEGMKANGMLTPREWESYLIRI